jgi:preprotein translocase subunit SecD
MGQHFVAIVALALLVGCKPTQQNVPSLDKPEPSILQLRLVDDSPSTNSEQMVLSSKGENGPQQEVIYVEKALVLDASSVARTSLWERDAFIGMDIELTDTASKQFAEFTRHNIGRRVAIIIDGRLREAGEIKNKITNGQFYVRGDWSVEEARILAKKIERAGKPDH